MCSNSSMHAYFIKFGFVTQEVAVLCSTFAEDEATTAASLSIIKILEAILIPVLNKI